MLGLAHVLVAAMMLAPAPTAFGVSDDAALRAFPDAAGVARSTGFGVARMYLGWREVAGERPENPQDPDDPAYDWSQPDADFKNYQKAGLQTWIALWRTPDWANGDRGPARWADSPDDLADFAVAVVRRYPQVNVLMDWNEPNLRTYADPNDVVTYARYAKAVHAAVHRERPGIKVASGNFAQVRGGGRDPVAWIEAMRDLDVPIDVLSVHAHADPVLPLGTRHTPTRIDLFDVPALARLARAPVIVSEMGWSSDAAGLAGQATALASAIQVARCTPGLAGMILWGFHDHPVPEGSEANPWVRYGLLDATSRPKPALAAVKQALASEIDCEDVAVTSGAPPGWPGSAVLEPSIDELRPSGRSTH